MPEIQLILNQSKKSLLYHLKDELKHLQHDLSMLHLFLVSPYLLGPHKGADLGNLEVDPGTPGAQWLSLVGMVLPNLCK